MCIRMGVSVSVYIGVDVSVCVCVYQDRGECVSGWG